MSVRMNKGHIASRDDIAALQREIGGALPPEFLDFVAGNDGAEPDPNIFSVDGTNDLGVNGFIPVAEIPDETRLTEDLPSGKYPVAWAEGGNYVLIDPSRGGAVYFWDHERPDETIRIANDFLSFLDRLMPFDVRSIELKPGQVEAAWIDPDFLKNLQG